MSGKCRETRNNPPVEKTEVSSFIPFVQVSRNQDAAFQKQKSRQKLEPAGNVATLITINTSSLSVQMHLTEEHIPPSIVQHIRPLIRHFTLVRDSLLHNYLAHGYLRRFLPFRGK